jgi:hypothetical protein
MTEPLTPLTFEDVITKMVSPAGYYVAGHYKRYLVTPDDCKQEIYLWAYSDTGKRWIEKRLERDPQQTTRIRYKLRSVAKSYAEKMKAEKVGYSVDDIHWYSTTQIVALLPLALDDTFDGFGLPDYDSEKPKSDSPRTKRNLAETGDLTVMVLDIRRALKTLDAWVLDAVILHQQGESPYDAAVTEILHHLGGPKEYVGKRRSINNAQAQARTGENYGG